MNKIDQYRAILKEVDALDENLSSNKKALKEMFNDLIRKQELENRSYEYFHNGYNLGYFLIESQKIEGMVVGIISNAKKLREKVTRLKEKNIEINKPLGPLIKMMGKYISGDVVFKPLNEFNAYRRSVIHRLNEDFSKKLSDIEISIVNDYPPSKIDDLVFKLFEVNRRINQEWVNQMECPVSEKNTEIELLARMKNLSDLSSLEFTIL